MLKFFVADPDPGSGAFLGSGINIQDTQHWTLPLRIHKCVRNILRNNGKFSCSSRCGEVWIRSVGKFQIQVWISVGSDIWWADKLKEEDIFGVQHNFDWANFLLHVVFEKQIQTRTWHEYSGSRFLPEARWHARYPVGMFLYSYLHVFFRGTVGQEKTKKDQLGSRVVSVIEQQ